MKSIRLLLIISLILFCGDFTTAQIREKLVLANEKIPTEKIYVHTDSETYFQGDTLWFKIYLTDSRSGQLIPKPENIYIKLTDGSGVSVLQSVLLAANGQAVGNFSIPDDVKTGNYLVQAYTNYLLNFGADGCFYRQISISRITGNGMVTTEADRTGNMVARVDFMPEGGVLLENATNLVAFKAVSKLGYGVNASGKVKDGKGNIVATFTTDYKGMGLFFLTPEAGKTYYATVDGFPSFRHQFQPENGAVKVQLINHTTHEIIINIAGSDESVSGKPLNIACMNRGEILFYQSFVMDGINKVMKFESSSLKTGINQLVLFDENLKPLSERLLFSGTGGVNSILVQTQKPVYGKREEVILKIADEKWVDENDFSSLSLAVLHEAVIPKNGFSKNVLSNMLIDSELNGYLDPTADLFADDEISSEAKLRLVMLTHGNDNYFWNKAPLANATPKYRQEAGLQINGVAKSRLTGEKLSKGEITLAIQKDNEVAFLTQPTDSIGNFSFAGLLFTDTATVHVQAKNESGGLNTEIELAPVFKPAPDPGPRNDLLKEWSVKPAKLAEIKYSISNENKKHQPKAIVRRHQQKEKQSDGHFRLYESPDFVLEVGDFESSYDNVLDFMVGKVPGVDISGNDIKIRGTGTFGTDVTPLFLIDGVPLVSNASFNLPDEVTQEKDEQGRTVTANMEQIIQTVKAIPLNDIEKVEILKSAQHLSVFGTKGSNGVIAIYTRRGEKNNEKTEVRGITGFKLAGYAPVRSFRQSAFTEKPDFRTLLYWNNSVTTKNGEAEIQFLSSDLPGIYHVIVEGISNNGKICLGSCVFRIE